MTRHIAGTVTYDGNVEHLVGEIKGPTTYDRHVIAVDAFHDREFDTTRVTYAFMTEADVERAQLVDGFGTMVVDGVGETVHVP